MEPVELPSLVCAKPEPMSRPKTPTNKFHPPLAVETPRVPVSPHRTASDIVIGNVDLVVLIAEQITDTQTLLNLLEAWETGRQIVKQMPMSMITALLNLLPLEIRQMAIAILTLESIKLSNTAEREAFINTYLGHSDEPLPILSDPVKAFFQIKDIVAAVETFEPLYIDSCKRDLETIHALTLASRLRYLPYKYQPDRRSSWRRKDLIDSSYNLVAPDERADLQHLATLPNPWRLPPHPIETYRIKRSFWRFELFCRLFPEVPSMETGNDVELDQDRKAYLARLQQWECEEVASIVPFLFRLLERIYDPAVFRNQASHLERSQFQWSSFLSQAPAEETIPIKEEPSPWQNAESWQKRLSFAACVCEEWEECSALGCPGHDGRFLGKSVNELNQQKWLAHQVSKGMRHIFACHQQFIRDEGKVISKHYPIRCYEPWQFYRAPVEVFLRWHWSPGGK